MACLPTTVTQKYTDYLLTEDSFSVLESLSDTLLAITNPIESFDQKELFNLNLDLNRSLSKIELSNYPMLENRFFESPILYTELGDFILQTGISLLDLKSIVEEFVIYSNSIGSNFKISSDLIITNVPIRFINILSLLENYYTDNIANNISGGYCSSFRNPFNQISSIVSTISTSSLQTNSNTDSIFDQIGTIKSKIFQIVDSLKTILLSRLNSLKISFINIVPKFGVNSRRMFKEFRKRYINAQNFLSDSNVSIIKKSVSSFIEKSVKQYENLSPEILSLLSFRYCQFSEMVQTFMSAPVDDLRDYVRDSENEYTLVETVSTINTKNAVESGATRISKEGIRVTRERLTKKSKEVSDEIGEQKEEYPVGRCYIKSPYIEIETVSQILDMNENGINGKITFSESVSKMHNRRGVLSDAKEGDGWKKVDERVWENMIKISDTMKKTFHITSAYRSPMYNKLIGGAKNSFHTTGKAIDVSMSGLTSTQIKTFIQLASQVGFNGMAYYPKENFIHLDIRSSPKTGWTTNGIYDSFIQAHIRGEYRRGSISI